MVWEIVILVSSIVSIAVALYLYKWVLAQDNRNEAMEQFSQEVQEGADAYLKLLFGALALLAIGIALLILVLMGWRMAVALLLGAASSGTAAYIGTFVATRANARVAWAARSGLREAFPVGFYAGGVMGLSVVGFAVLGMTVVYMIFRDPHVVLAFSFGASTVALLGKAGGGIYTKTADIGADLVGKVEFGLAEDDARNPAVVADNVGDNVGDVAGMGSDMYDSYVAAVVAVMILGAVLYSEPYVLYPLVVSAAGIFASLLGMLFVRTGGTGDPGRGLNAGTIATTLIFAVFALGVVFAMDIDHPWGVYWPTMAGLLAGIVIGFTSDRYTDIDQGPAQTTAESAQTGAAIVIINGFSFGLVSLVPAILGICVAMIAAWFLAQRFGVAGVYGVSVSAVGMMAITGMIMSSDAYGPIVDNARGCAQYGGEDEETIAVCDRLDAAGNTAKAITKGFAIGGAALTVLALFASYAETVDVRMLDLRTPNVMVGVFLGALMPPLLSALLMLSVGRNAELMVQEIRRQFNEVPGILEGTVRPDSARCVSIAAGGALKELILPGLLSLLTPALVGVFLGTHALGGFLGGSILTGIIFALFMANSGGLWDNAKKYIEDGAYGGKGSEAHAAAVIGDTVGDPFKDTAGPSLNTMIVVMSLSASVFGPLIATTGLSLLG
ncbi:MAG: sodium-translocating pyrophosphatase [Anaerolineales bacterium]